MIAFWANKKAPLNREITWSGGASSLLDRT
nr:MAG TPA: hypothetical protein [Caudoviricetes sp.]